MTDYYMTNSGAKKYKRSRIGQFSKIENAEALVAKARRANHKGITVEEGVRGAAWGKPRKVYRVYVDR
jgi:hypothetical protein